MKPRKHHRLCVQRNLHANFGHGEWFRIEEYQTHEDAVSAANTLRLANPDERYRVYNGSIVSYDTGRGRAAYINTGMD